MGEGERREMGQREVRRMWTKGRLGAGWYMGYKGEGRRNVEEKGVGGRGRGGWARGRGAVKKPALLPHQLGNLRMRQRSAMEAGQGR